MKCARARELIHAYLDGVIGPPDQHALDDHLAACAACRRDLETTRATLGLLVEVPRRQLGAEFDRALQARIDALGPRRSPWPVWSRLWQMNAWRLRPALVPMVALLAVLATVQLRPERPAGTEGASLEPGLYVAQCLLEHEAGARWNELPEAAVDFNFQVSSTASAVADLIQ